MSSVHQQAQQQAGARPGPGQPAQPGVAGPQAKGQTKASPFPQFLMQGQQPQQQQQQLQGQPPARPPVQQPLPQALQVAATSHSLMASLCSVSAQSFSVLHLLQQLFVTK